MMTLKRNTVNSCSIHLPTQDGEKIPFSDVLVDRIGKMDRQQIID
jgi:hypothetical protein